MLSRKPVQVLIVDDEPSLCKALTIALKRNGYDVEAVLAGEAALGILRARHVDILLLDLRIPDMRGDVIFEMAAALQPHLRCQTVFMTGDITEDGREFIDNCECRYLQKPFDLSQLTEFLALLAPAEPGVRGATA